MTFWWDRLGRQVRIMGTAISASREEADEIFRERSHEARVVSAVSQQSEPLTDPTELRQRIEEALRAAAPVSSEHWGAFWIRPSRIEFLRFEESRLHERRVYVRDDGERWLKEWLCP